MKNLEERAIDCGFSQFTYRERFWASVIGVCLCLAGVNFVFLVLFLALV